MVKGDEDATALETQGRPKKDSISFPQQTSDQEFKTQKQLQM